MLNLLRQLFLEWGLGDDLAALVARVSIVVIFLPEDMIQHLMQEV